MVFFPWKNAPTTNFRCRSRIAVGWSNRPKFGPLRIPSAKPSLGAAIFSFGFGSPKIIEKNGKSGAFAKGITWFCCDAFFTQNTWLFGEDVSSKGQKPMGVGPGQDVNNLRAVLPMLRPEVQEVLWGVFQLAGCFGRLLQVESISCEPRIVCNMLPFSKNWNDVALLQEK